MLHLHGISQVILTMTIDDKREGGNGTDKSSHQSPHLLMMMSYTNHYHVIPTCPTVQFYGKKYRTQHKVDPRVIVSFEVTYISHSLFYN